MKNKTNCISPRCTKCEIRIVKALNKQGFSPYNAFLDFQEDKGLIGLKFPVFLECFNCGKICIGLPASNNLFAGVFCNSICKEERYSHGEWEKVKSGKRKMRI